MSPELNTEVLLVTNIYRVLAHYGLEPDAISDCVKAAPDRIWVWPNGTLLLDVIKAGLEDGSWVEDPPCIDKIFHGDDVVASYREGNGVHPSMQVTIHASGLYEIDLDYSAPGVDLVNDLEHGWEVLDNKTTGKLTNQQKVSRLLDKRFGHRNV